LAGQPVFLDCITFRIGLYSSHFGEVRPGIESDIAAWEKRDPLKRLGKWLIRQGMASAGELEELRRDEERRTEETFTQVLAEVK
jgi:pyruvate dehydrogenase E1 component alpha subunit